MRDLFPGFYEQQMTEDDLKKLWQEAIFIFDTNMLLNVYRYSQEARERYFEILTRLKEQIWIPYQVAYEYQEGRAGVIQQQLNAYDDVSKILRDSLQSLKKALKAYDRKHSFINPKNLIENIAKAVEEADTTVKKAKKNHPDFLKQYDLYREKLEQLFLGKVGPQYSREKLDELYKKAAFRLEIKMPPGSEDSEKKDYKKYGDTIIWLQIIDHARVYKRPIVFITDDLKKDWWLLGYQSRGPDRPRPELVHEMFVETGNLFYMYQGPEFLYKGQKLFKLEEKPDVIEEAKEILTQNSTALSLHHNVTQRSGRINRPGFIAEVAAAEWLADRYPEFRVIQRSLRPSSPMYGFDFILNEIDGRRLIFVEVKFKSIPFGLVDVYKTINQINHYSQFPYNVEPLPMNFPNEEEILKMIILVHEDREKASTTAATISKSMAIPEKTRIVVGYLQPDESLSVITILGVD